jgi:transcription-repair coupling factor (superfamily II helicase)
MGGENTARPFPSKEWVLTKIDSASGEFVHTRIAALASSMDGSAKIVSSSAESLMQPTIPETVLKENILTLSRGDSCDLTQLKERLVAAGYTLSEKTEGTSQFSVRGDLLDIFPVTAEAPVRIEFWGDEIDSISVYDPETQRRSQEIESIEIAPASEVLYDKEELIEKIERLSKTFRGKRAPLIKEQIGSDIEHIENGIFPFKDKYAELIYGKKTSILDYDFSALIWYDFNACAHGAEGAEARYAEDLKALLAEGILFRGTDEYYLSFEAAREKAAKFTEFYCSSFVQSAGKVQYKQLTSAEAFQNSVWGGQMVQLCEDILGYVKSGYRIMLAAGSEKTLPLIKSDLEKNGIKCRLASETDDLRPGEVLLADGALSAGFEYPENKTVLITQSKSQKSRKRKAKHKAGAAIKTLADIRSGDLVVHSMYGIGKFVGIKQLELEGIIKDYITIEYSGKENLFVPVTQMDMVSRYIGADNDSGVKLNKLSSTEWKKAKSNTRKAVKDMANELIAIYAKREQEKGFEFYPDDEMQREFEARFPYVETDDQLTSIEEIKQDMERSRPMDRLLCGDVGFGKTEVALRAAMKTVLSGKQAAILAPTTVLAWQHYQTAVRRFEPFAVKVELLSRFRKPKEQKAVLEELKKGTVDILIGTHRILQKDVEFKDLGLAVIDEEQRFGVAHKEKFKKIFAGIDILTLSATPIPRTLNMAMSGLRDMSVLQEPPQDRYPVQTYVLEYSDAVIMQAINRELKRGGQVYYIHNDIRTIELTAGKLMKMFPDARISYAHGQMEENRMSEIWQDVVEQNTDILVCTTIIETGVDVPNANTLIIENADRFGLSQLYQLRGRVGRSSRRGYAYFTYRKNKPLTEIAEKRLRAMREFTDFGSGFNIAMRDLEIRGAGSVLGGQQHGHMESVGYDLYLKMLEEAIAEEKGEPIKKAEECLIDLRIDAHIPDSYIESMPQKLAVYSKIAAIATEEDREDLVDELIDRYGEPPESVMGLITISMMRNRAAGAGISEISQRGGKFMVYIKNLSFEQISTFSIVFHGQIEIQNSRGQRCICIKDTEKMPMPELIEKIVEIAEKA